MRALAHKLLLLALLLAATGVMRAQFDGYPRVGDTVYIHNCRTDHGSFMYYSSVSFLSGEELWLVFYSYGESLSITLGRSWMAPSNVRIWVGDTTGTPVVSEGSVQTGYTSYTFDRDTVLMCLGYSVDISYSYYYLQLTYSFSQLSNNCTASPITPYVTNVTDTEADISWNAGGSRFLVQYDDQSISTTENSVHLTGLNPNTIYEVSVNNYIDRNKPCCATTISFRTQITACDGYPDLADLNSPYVLGMTGYTGNPYSTIGIVDYGPANNLSRHTVHTDPNETDPNTGGMLHTVCPGMASSVRLGNSSVGGEAESLIYNIRVDTLLYSLLVLRYAVVLEDPDHDLSSQPRFRLEILNQQGQVIDPVCGVADFIANSNLGWQTAGSDVLWKDWTAVGFDLTPYHGQVIQLRLTTYDCSHGGHYGYAYFNADFIHKSMSSNSCGTVDSNSLTAPLGFNYRWYFLNPATCESTNRTFSFATDEDLFVHCILVSTENPSCQVTMSSFCGYRYPYAEADTVCAYDPNCQGMRVQFLNHSTILAPPPHNENCETARWYFGDGDSSTLISPQHHYHDTGTYRVTLVAGIGNDQCVDSIHIYVTVHDTYRTYPADTTACDSLLWEDGIWYHTGDSGATVRYPRPGTCDSVRVLNLTVNNSRRTELTVDTFCYSSRYLWNGRSYGTDTATHIMHYYDTATLSTVQGCDSVVMLHLVQLPSLYPAIQKDIDCHYQKYTLTAPEGLPHWRWRAVPPDAALDPQTSLQRVLLAPERSTVYILTAYWDEKGFCPSSDSITLHPITFPKAVLSANPDALTQDHLDIDALDRSLVYDHRRWSMVHHVGTLDDTVELSDTERGIHYIAPYEDDSITVVLAVSNNICYDTAQKTIPLLKPLYFVPNVFTPSGDANNRFAIVSREILQGELTLYNRQGLQVFSTQDLTSGWDGTHNGDPCPQGSYVWHLHYRASDRPDSWRHDIGAVILLR